MSKFIGHFALVLVLATTLIACLDQSDQYDSISDAKDSRVFEKGWLPDLLPTSTYDLKVITTVEVSAGRGEFRFSPNEYRAFSQRLSTYDGRVSKIERDAEAMGKLLSIGYEARTYSSRSTHWVFLCKATDGDCKFFVWQ